MRHWLVGYGMSSLGSDRLFLSSRYVTTRPFEWSASPSLAEKRLSRLSIDRALPRVNVKLKGGGERGVILKNHEEGLIMVI